MAEDETTATDELRVVGTGLTVYQDSPVQGPVVWLDSPDAVLDFVDTGDPEETIVVSRGGTTTFLTPALAAGVKGVITLQGAPESHLGIMSREYGIPCLMSVTFEEGIRSPRGEVIPPDGAVVMLDVSSAPKGRVLIPSDTSLGTPAAEDVDPEAARQAAEEGARIQKLVERYRGELPNGAEGDRHMREQQKTDVLQLADESLRRDLQPAEINDLLAYYGWNMWDILAARVTEGESGLIPRQEYEVLSVYVQWKGHPRWHRLITDAVGVDGLRDIGSIAHKEVGTKINLVHIWATGTPIALGRGIAVDLGLEGADDHPEDLATAMQFSRRLYRGMWQDDGPMFTSTREYRAPLLADEWLVRFRDERTEVTDPDQRAAFQKFNAGTGLLSFLLHFDNRAGVADSGPYPQAGGGWIAVRDHVLNEPAYPWSGPCEGLPYALTLAMFFSDEPGMEQKVVDIGTLFTSPANYLKNLTGYAVYARDHQDTPISELRRLDEAEMADILRRADAAAADLYPQIARMSDREKIMAGVHVYYTDFVAPFARAAGVWDKMVNELGFYDFDDAVDAVYDKIVTEGRAPKLLVRHWMTGEGFVPVPAP